MYRALFPIKHSNRNVYIVLSLKLPFNCDDRQFKDKFRKSGPVEFAEIKYRDGLDCDTKKYLLDVRFDLFFVLSKSRGCGLIKYYSPSDAQRAVGMRTFFLVFLLLFEKKPSF
jgi:RNA recognition motif-containing protein